MSLHLSFGSFGKRIKSRGHSTRRKGGHPLGSIHRRPRFESLEERTLLSVSTGFEEAVAATNSVGDASWIAGPPPVDDVTPGLPAVNQDDLVAAFGLNKDGPMASVGWDLVLLYYQYRAAVDVGIPVAAFRSRNPFLPLRGNGVSVDLVTSEPLKYEQVDKFGDVEEVTNWQLIDQLEAAGVRITAVGEYLSGAWVPFDAIDDLAGLSFVSSARPAYYAQSVGATTSQGDEAQRSDEVRTAEGLDGDGVSVGILSGSYDYLDGESQDVASGDLPGDVTVLEDLPVPDLIAHWKLNETSGLEASDSSGNGYDGTLYPEATPPQWVEGYHYNALQFDRYEDYVTADPLEVDTDLGDSNTVTFWMKWDGFSNKVVFSWDTEYDLYFNNNDYFGFNTYHADMWGTSSAELDNEWVHVAAVFYNASDGQEVRDNCKLYIDGVEQELVADGPNMPYAKSASTTVYMGSGSLENYRYYFGGLVDDARIYNRELTAEEIERLFIAGFEEGIDEGRAMAQIVHDVAPGADLLFHTARATQRAYANSIQELAAAGADVIVDDIIYLAEPMFMDGVVAQAVDEVVADGVAYFSAAGNFADQSYESGFTDSGTTYEDGDFESDQGAPHFYGGTAHDFDPGPGTDLLQKLTLAPYKSILLSFQWDEPFESVTGSAGSANDLDIYLFNSAGTTVLDGSVNRNIGLDPVELFIYTNDTGSTADFNLMITWYEGAAAPGLMKYVNFTYDDVTFEYATDSSTLYGHANAAGATAVGAAAYWDTPEFGTSPPEKEYFTALGGTEILFDTDGNRLGTPEDRMKPDVVGPDRVNTTFFGSVDYEPDGFPNFIGTSASAPHVAGLAALMLEAAPAAPPAAIYSALESTAVDMEGAGFDYLTGYGLVDGVAATAEIMAKFPNFDANDDPAPGDQADNHVADTFILSRDGANIEITINGSLLDPIPVSSIDGLSITGSSDDDSVTVNFLGADFDGIVAIFGQNNPGDVAVLLDSPGDDTFTAYPTQATFEIADGYTATANNQRYVHGYGTAGGTDAAFLHDSVNDDHFIGRETYARLWYDEGAVYGVRARSFDSVHAYANNETGDTDTADLYDSAGDDTFKAEAELDYARLYGTGFNNRAKYFASVTARSSSGNDLARLYDSTGDDTFSTTPADPRIGTLAGSGFSNTAQWFPTMRVYAYQGGTDAAFLYDTAADNTFTATPSQATLTGGPLDITVNAFDGVHAYAQNGGTDTATLYDSAGDDTFKAEPELDYARLYGTGFNNRAKYFDNVFAFASTGNDLARLYDSTGDDTFTKKDDYAILEGAGFYNRANLFDSIYAKANAGGDDEAYLWGTTGDDHLVASGDTATLTTSDNIFASARWFDFVKPYSQGGNDTDDITEPLDFDLDLTDWI